MYTYTCIHIHVYIYTYIHIHICICISISYIYILYLYIYIHLSSCPKISRSRAICMAPVSQRSRASEPRCRILMLMIIGYTISYYTRPYCTILYYTILYYTILSYTILYTILGSLWLCGCSVFASPKRTGSTATPAHLEDFQLMKSIGLNVIRLGRGLGSRSLRECRIYMYILYLYMHMHIYKYGIPMNMYLFPYIHMHTGIQVYIYRDTCVYMSVYVFVCTQRLKLRCSSPFKDEACILTHLCVYLYISHVYVYIRVCIHVYVYIYIHIYIYIYISAA